MPSWIKGPKFGIGDPRHPHLSSSVRRNETGARPSDDDATRPLRPRLASYPCSHAHAHYRHHHRHPGGKDCNPVEMRGDRSCPPLPGSRPRTRVCMRTLLPACVRGVETGEIQYKRGRGDKASTLQRLLVSVDASKQLKRRIEVLGLVAPHGAW
jgi:hypothetical protein